MRIATWNIAAGHKLQSSTPLAYAEQDLSYFIDQLRRIDCDVICLQEAENRPDTGYSMAKDIADQLGIDYIFETLTHPSHIRKNALLSLAIISKNPLTETIATPQPYPSFPLTLPDGNPAKKHVKYLQHAKIDGIMVANVHTQPLEFLGTPYESDLGKEYAEELNQLFIRELQRPLIFTGDFCADLHTSHVANIYTRTCETLQLTDILPPGQTKPFNKGRSDAIFVSPELTTTDSSITETMTDHFLCWATIQ